MGIALNGVLIFRDHEGPNGTRVFDNEFDDCLGHTKADGRKYHYHFLPTCLFGTLGIPTPNNKTFWASGHTVNGAFSAYWQVREEASPVIGWALVSARAFLWGRLTLLLSGSMLLRP